MTRVLLIDDDAEIVKLVTDLLQAEGYAVASVLDSSESLRRAFEFRPDVVLLDINMPTLDGWEVCRKLRDFYDGTIIMLTGRDGELDKVKGLDLGADDYMVKPLSGLELLARIRSHLRESDKVVRNMPDYGDGYLQIDLQNRTVRCKGELFRLPHNEFSVLACLVHHTGETVSHKRLLIEGLGLDYIDQGALLKVYIHHLRDKIEVDPTHPQYVVTHRAYGYSFMPAPDSHLADR
ncbi:MAG: response regulator transcription factor [Chloroflexi bacterium]|nr:response regulator transcription factor [Chloroflexota bacterium]